MTLPSPYAPWHGQCVERERRQGRRHLQRSFRQKTQNERYGLKPRLRSWGHEWHSNEELRWLYPVILPWAKFFSIDRIRSIFDWADGKGLNGYDLSWHWLAMRHRHGHILDEAIWWKVKPFLVLARTSSGNSEKSRLYHAVPEIRYLDTRFCTPRSNHYACINTPHYLRCSSSHLVDVEIVSNVSHRGNIEVKISVSVYIGPCSRTPSLRRADADFNRNVLKSAIA